jgi:iron complex outermembrane recepter protein
MKSRQYNTHLIKPALSIALIACGIAYLPLLHAQTSTTEPASSETKKDAAKGDEKTDKSADTKTPQKVETITVKGARYRSEVSSGGARIDAPVKDLPLSISVITDALIEDLAIRNLVNLADQVAGVSQRSGGPGAFTNDFTVRGFSSFSSGAAVNGFRSDGFVQAREPQHFERVEFLKGPASVLYGASGALGGLVNYVTKTPQRDVFTKISLSGGQFSYGRTTLDANAPLGADAEARVNLALTREDRLQSFTDTTSTFVAPTVRWRPASGLSLLAEAFYFKGKEGGRESSSRPSVPESFAIPTRFNIGEPDAKRELKNYGGRAEAIYALSSSMDLRQGFFYSRAISDGVDDFPFNGGRDGLFASATSFNRSRNITQDTSKDLSSQTELRWRFNLGGTKHKALFGFEYLSNNFGPYFFFEQPLAPIDFAAPEYSGPTAPSVFTFEGKSASKTRALYAQDFIEVGERWKALLGLRYDNVVSTASFCGAFEGCLRDADPAVRGETPGASERAFSPRAGVVFSPVKDLNLYASWTKSFNPNPFPDRLGNILPPERGTQFEIGVKHTLPSAGLTYSLALFDLVRSNVPTDDPVDNSFQIAVGEQRSRGVEIEASWQPTVALQLGFNAAVIDAKVTRDNVFAVGTRLSESPRVEAGLTALTSLGALGAPNTEFFMGAYYTGKRETLARPEVQQLPAATRVDIAVFHQLTKSTRLKLNINNVFNKRIYDPTNQGFREQSPRQITVGLTAAF